MFLAHGCMFMGLIMYISGIRGQSKHICAFKGSTVNLTCVTENPYASMRWFTVHKDYTGISQNEISEDGNHITFKISENNPSTLVIKDVRSSDENDYCCIQTGESDKSCWTNRIQVHVSDLQVKVIPAKGKQTVTLICSTSCPRTENPSAYIWYKNREFLYEDWSPWFQHLVSSDQKVTYSCAVKGQEDSRAPEVSVDSITPSCFNVTYSGGTMCSDEEKPAGRRCSITYPRELYINKTLTHDEAKLTCHTSCPLTESQTVYSWYRDGHLQPHITSQSLFIKMFSDETFACTVKGNEDLLSEEFCGDELNCWRVNYDRRRICGLQGSSVEISCKYLDPFKKQSNYKSWYKKKSGEEDAEELTEAVGRVKFYDYSGANQHILEIQKLQKSDSAEYTFRPRDDKDQSQTYSPGVTVIVSDLRVKSTPSALVTEGQKVTLTCSTSCPLPDDTYYTWYLNRKPLTLPDYRGKVLVLHSVSMQHAGNYSCGVTTQRDIRSPEETLTVHGGTEGWIYAAAGVAAALVVTLLGVVLWLRKRRSSSQSPQTETSFDMEQQNPSPVNEDTSAEPAEQEPDDLQCSTVHSSESHADLNLIQPHHQQQQKDVAYSEVYFTPKQYF